jgi:uncharacterized protein
MTSMLADDPSVVRLRTRLGDDLRLAMKQRDLVAASAIRSILSSLDNASAVPQTHEHVPVFGKRGDVPRRYLSWRDAEALLLGEAQERRQAASTYESLLKDDDARRMRRELEVICRYVTLDT